MGKDQKQIVLEFYELEKKYAKSFSKALFHLAEQEKKIPFDIYLKKKTSLDVEKIMKDLSSIVFTRLIAGVEYYSLAQYQYMTMSGEWTEAGQDRVKSGMAYLFLNKRLDEDLSFLDYEQFETVFRQRLAMYELQDKSKDQLLSIIKNPKIEVLGKSFEFSKSEQINNILHVLGSKRRIIMGQSGDYISMIFGVCHSVKYNKYDIYYFYKEEMRTPAQVQYIVALIEQNQIAIRREVCEYIFYKKWLPVADSDFLGLDFFASSSENDIAEKLKKSVLDLYGVKDRQSMMEIKKNFVDNMMENFLFHEIAHDALEESNLTEEELAISSSFGIIEENILTVVNEVLTEWMPQKGNISGPIKNITNTAFQNGDNLKAKQLLFMYLSDGWFLDTDTEFMYPYTDIMFAVLLKFFQDEIDFASLYNSLNDIFEHICSWYRNTINEVLLELKQFKYILQGQECTFTVFKSRVMIALSIMDSFSNRNFNESQQLSRLWVNIMTQIREIHPELLQKIRVLLQQKQDQLFVSLLSKYSSENSVSKYGKDLRKYILDGMQDVNYELIVSK